MNRFKFRAWDTQANKMIDDPPLFNESESLNHVLSQLEDCKIILMQYTGIKDKNGVEVYEGDILTVTTDDNHLVYPDYSHWEALNMKPPESLWGEHIPVEFLGGGWCPWFINGDALGIGVEVIGNIYESPETDHEPDH